MSPLLHTRLGGSPAPPGQSSLSPPSCCRTCCHPQPGPCSFPSPHRSGFGLSQPSSRRPRGFSLAGRVRPRLWPGPGAAGRSRRPGKGNWSCSRRCRPRPGPHICPGTGKVRPDPRVSPACSPPGTGGHSIPAGNERHGGGEGWEQRSEPARERGSAGPRPRAAPGEAGLGRASLPAPPPPRAPRPPCAGPTWSEASASLL